MNPEEAKSALLKLREDLSQRVARTHKHIYEREERVSADFAEQSVELANEALVAQLDAEGKEELKKIDTALQRIAEGTYGECKVCGEDIAEARLNALPYATLCIACATAEEG